MVESVRKAANLRLQMVLLAQTLSRERLECHLVRVFGHFMRFGALDEFGEGLEWMWMGFVDL